MLSSHLRTGALAALAATFPALALADDGPSLDLPDADPTSDAPVTDPAVAANADDAPDIDTTWGLEDQRRLGHFGNTTVGGYGELHYNLTIPEGGGDNESEIDLHRLVVFVAHRFNEQLSTYAEIEVEHAFVKGDDNGEVAIEQAFVDYAILGDALTLRAGVFLVPMGIVNIWHEPPIFHGVERPTVDKLIIPSTWREGGLSLLGEPIEGFRYELAVISGLDPTGFSASAGIRGGRQRVAEAVTNGPALVGRVEVEPTLGMVVGASGYWSNAGRNVSGQDIDVTVTGADLDFRLKRAGFEAKAVLAYFSIGGTEDLRALTDDEGQSIGPDIGSSLLGAYGELAYDVLHLTDSSHQLLPFVRVERYDTALTADDDSLVGDRGFDEYVFGLSYRPHPSVVFKTDYILRRPDEGPGEDVWDLGVGWMF